MRPLFHSREFTPLMRPLFHYRGVCLIRGVLLYRTLTQTFYHCKAWYIITTIYMFWPRMTFTCPCLLNRLIDLYWKESTQYSLCLWIHNSWWPLRFSLTLNSDGEQFHQYQQNKQPSLTSNHWTQKRKRTMTYVVGTPGPGLRQTNKMFVLRGDQVNGSKILSYRRITLSIVKYLVKIKSTHCRYLISCLKRLIDYTLNQ